MPPCGGQWLVVLGILHMHSKTTKTKLDPITQQHGWSEAEMRAKSPRRIPNTPGEQTRELLKLFEPDDLLICRTRNDLQDWLFRCQSCETWLEGVSGVTGVLIGTIPGVADDYDDFERNVKFFVFEDVVSTDPKSHGALFRWLRECFRIDLCAVLKAKDGSRYQAWFRAPANALSEVLHDHIEKRYSNTPLWLFDYPTFTAELPTGGAYELIYLDSQSKGGCHE
jgi:hypothetical protein